MAAVAAGEDRVMFERLARRGERLSRERADARREQLAGQLDERAAGLAATVEGEAVVLSGRGLARRYAWSPELRWRIAEACDER